MAAITATNLYSESAGSLKLHIATFAAGATSLDTWTSGIPGVYGYWANATSASNTATNANGVQVALTTASTGLFTFRADTTNETMTNFTFFVLSKS